MLSKAYSIFTPNGSAHTCTCVTLCGISPSLRLPFVIFQEKLLKGAPYDLIAANGGGLRPGLYGAEDESVRAISVGLKLHNANKVALFAVQASLEYNVTNPFDPRCSDRAFIIETLQCGSDIIKRVAQEELKRAIDVALYFVAVSPDGQEFIFYSVKDSHVHEVDHWPVGRNLSHYDTVVVRCMDFRFRYAARRFVEYALDESNYALVSIPGAVKGLLTDGQKSSSYESIKTAIEDYKAKRVVLINHLDCGAYGGSAACDHDTQKENDLHCGDLDRAALFLTEHFPQITIETYLERLTTDEMHVRFDPIKQYGGIV